MAGHASGRVLRDCLAGLSVCRSPLETGERTGAGVGEMS